ncbi:MAG TPA: class I SAM-dependent methyltransferase [Microthrixaceae bacterium]|nr:class I SAM-dependent methyltransferase [Microthrixaceae bacterium]
MTADDEPTEAEVEAGHAFYTRRSLAVYDLMILGYFSRLAWRCPAGRIVAHYDQHVTGNHLDIGVGTGYFLDRCRYPTSQPRIALLDASTACLDAASRRIARYGPTVHEASVLEPFDLEGAPFDSIGMNYLLHCLPGTIRSKEAAFRNAGAVAAPGASVFGATLLHGGVKRNWFARQVMARNNRVGIFSNRDDDLDGLRAILDRQLTEVSIDVVGCVAVFAGKIRQDA